MRIFKDIFLFFKLIEAFEHKKDIWLKDEPVLSTNKRKLKSIDNFKLYL